MFPDVKCGGYSYCFPDLGRSCHQRCRQASVRLWTCLIVREFVYFFTFASCSHAQTTPPSVDCASPPQSGYPFCNSALSVDERVDDLLSRLDVIEKINQTYERSVRDLLLCLPFEMSALRSLCLRSFA